MRGHGFLPGLGWDWSTEARRDTFRGKVGTIAPY
jgi:hypothetical protein